MTQIVEDDYTRKYMPELIGVELIPKFWHETDEDAIWCECPSNPKLSNYFYYASLLDWSILK